MKRFFLVITLILMGLSLNARKTDAEIYTNLDSFIRKVRSDWEVPGMSVTVIKDGKVFLSKGYGVKVKGTRDSVDNKTIFQIGSVTKSFTATLVAMLVDEGKFDWNDRMIDLLPGFDLYGDTLETEVLLRDVMTHHIGLPKQSLTNAPYLGYDGDDILKMFPLVKPNAPLRTKLQYNNMTFLFMKALIEKYTGVSYEENLRTRIFEPLGLTTADYGQKAFLAAKNVTGQHSFRISGDEIICNQFTGDMRGLHWMDVVGAAGAITGTSEDVARWAEFHRRNGVAENGKRIISKEQMNYLHKGISILSQTEDVLGLYGTCWFIEQNNRYRLVYHSGSTWGQGTLCLWFPEEKLSIGIIFNSDAPVKVRRAIAERAYDLFKGNPDVDYSELAWEESLAPATSPTSSTKTPVISGFVTEFSTTRPADVAICGTYDKGEIFGKAYISQEEGKLYITIGPKGGKHLLRWTKGNEYNFTSDGKKFSLRIALDSDNTVKGFDIDFRWMERLGLWNKTE